MESSNQFLGTERIGKLMQKYAIPCIISLLVGALYNIVDQIFIANASYLGSYGNAANTVVFPLTVVALAIAVMIGDGCCAFVSISLGQNEVPKAKRSVGNAVVMCLVSSIVLAALYLIFEDLLHFHGRHAMERQLEREAVGTNIQTISSVRGSSSHHNNPFLILCRQDATETSGACYGVMMVYSGSYQMDVERSQTGLVRVVSGIQEERFAWNLKPGETFDTPEVILSFAAEGLTPLSQQYHRFLRRNICRGPWKDKRRPVLINNWEATYFDFNTEKIVKIVPF